MSLPNRDQGKCMTLLPTMLLLTFALGDIDDNWTGLAGFSALVWLYPEPISPLNFSCMLKSLIIERNGLII